MNKIYTYFIGIFFLLGIITFMILSHSQTTHNLILDCLGNCIEKKYNCKVEYKPNQLTFNKGCEASLYNFTDRLGCDKLCGIRR